MYAASFADCHRNNPESLSKALEHFDISFNEVFELFTESDILIITSDHGCGPTTQSTDHSREYMPLLVYGHAINKVQQYSIALEQTIKSWKFQVKVFTKK